MNIREEILEDLLHNEINAYDLIEDVTKEILEVLMTKTRYNQVKAAGELKVSRGKLRADLKKYFGKKYIGTKDEMY